MATQAKEICLGFAQSSPYVRGLVLLGSFAVQQQSKTSDLDILFILKPGVNVTEYQRLLCEVFKKAAQLYKNKKEEDGEKEVEDGEKKDVGNGVITCYECDLLLEDKTVIYLHSNAGNSSNSLKVDCGHATNVMEKAKFIIGSEIKLHHLPKVILLDYCDDEYVHTADEKELKIEDQIKKVGIEKQKNGGIKHCIHNQLQIVLQSSDPYALTGLKDNDPKYHIHNFIEMFENCCGNVEKQDQYRTEFHLFLLRHRLIALELLFKGEREHIYLPKMAHKHVRMICIETRNVYQLLIRMLIQFQSLNVESLDEMFQQKFKSFCNFLQFRVKMCYCEYEKTNACQAFETVFKNIKGGIEVDNF